MVILPTATVAKEQLETYTAELLAIISASVNPGAATVLTLTGDLGAGKTTLVQSVAKSLGVTDVVTSPTFVVMKRYETDHPVFTSLVHIDAYRIESSDEMAPLRLAEILQESGTLVCIEWAERIADLLPTDSHRLTLSTVDEETRAISYERR